MLKHTVMLFIFKTDCPFFPSSPDADCLVLVGQVVRAVKVEGLDNVGVGSEVVLRAAVRSQVLELARELGHLEGQKRKLYVTVDKSTTAGRQPGPLCLHPHKCLVCIAVGVGGASCWPHPFMAGPRSGTIMPSR